MSNVRKLFDDFGCVIDGNGANPCELSSSEVIEVLAKYKAILFRNFSVDVVRFKEFTDQTCSQYMTHIGVAARRRFSQFSGDLSITEVTFGEGELPLHGEMYHSPGTPEAIWFYCEVPADIGGETTLADSHQLYLHLPEHIRDLFERKKLRYRHIDPPVAWQPQYLTESANDVVAILQHRSEVINPHVNEQNCIVYDYLSSAVRTSKFSSEKVFMSNIFISRNPANDLAAAGVGSKKQNAIEVVFEDGTPISDDILKEILSAATQVTRDVRWQANDFLMVDNTRVVHGRRAFKGKRKIATRIAAVI